MKFYLTNIKMAYSLCQPAVSVRRLSTHEWVWKRHIYSVECMFVWASTDLCLPASVRSALFFILPATLLTTECPTIYLFFFFSLFLSWFSHESFTCLCSPLAGGLLMSSWWGVSSGWEREPLFFFTFVAPPVTSLPLIGRGLTLEWRLCCAAQWRVHNSSSCTIR